MARVPIVYRFRWFFVLIVLPTMITWMISYRKGMPIINLPIIHASKESILFGLGKGMKVAALVLASVLFLSSTKVEELSVGLSRLGFPYRFGFTITLAFRLVPLFIDSALTVVDAQRLRGYDFDAGGPFETRAPLRAGHHPGFHGRAAQGQQHGDGAGGARLRAQ